MWQEIITCFPTRAELSSLICSSAVYHGVQSTVTRTAWTGTVTETVLD